MIITLMHGHHTLSLSLSLSISLDPFYSFSPFLQICQTFRSSSPVKRRCCGCQTEPSKKIATSVANEGRGLLDLLSERTPQPGLAHGFALRHVIGVAECVNFQHDVHEKGVSSSRQSNITEKVDAIPPESYLTDCISFCYVLPLEFRFTKDMLVSQWTAAGLIKLEDYQIGADLMNSEEDQIMEEVCSRCFNKLLNSNYIVATGRDTNFGAMYKVGDKMRLRGKVLGTKFRNDLEGEPTDMIKAEHLLLEGKDIDLIDPEILKHCIRLQTLIIHRCYGSKVKRLVPELFRELKNLKVFSVSRMDVEGCDMSNWKELRYLAISETPIMSLPERIGCLSNLETLKLERCSDIGKLPDSVSELVNLRHFFCYLHPHDDSMPKGMEKWIKLQTLSAFLVSGCHRIKELKFLDRLRGSLSIWHLQNVKTKEEAAEAQLSNKKGLKKIELLWSIDEREKTHGQEEILESLRPPSGIHELQIWMYSGGVFPSWISSPSFSELVHITLYRCRYCDSLPSLGDLPSLKRLKITENYDVVEIDSFFCRNQSNQHHVAFPKLEKLSVEPMSKLEKWTGVLNGDFPCLNDIYIHSCPRLVGLPFLSHLRSLTCLRIGACPELLCLPEGGLPLGLKHLTITHCPKLQKRCRNEECEDWSKVSHVPNLFI